MRPEDELKGQTIQPVGPPRGEMVREADRFQLVLAYLGPLSLIPLLTVKDSEFVQWHAKNGLVLGVGGMIALFILGQIPILGCVAVPLLFVALIVLDVMAMAKALRGTRWRIPGASDLADKL
jgi:fumarate reductase subunit D